MKALEILLMTLGGIWQGLRQDFNWLEIVVLAGAAVAWKRGWRPPWTRLPAIRHPGLAALLIAGGTVALRLALVPLLPSPVPVVTDEFSHLLLADTLLQGRVANPTHPFWEHFESLHIIQQPHYVSNYFPGHAILLAAGRLAVGSPWAGVLAECALFLIALFWALRGWMPARWAIFGMVLAALRFGIGSYWVNAFHGGFLPAAGGALVLGSSPRIVGRDATEGASGRRAFAYGLTMGAGLAILMATRPFEGACFSLAVLAAAGWKLRRWVPSIARAALAAALIVGSAALGLGLYFQGVTGSPFVTTYQISQKTYGWPMAFAWRTPLPVRSRHIEFANYYNYELSEREKVSNPVNFVEFLAFRVQEYWRFFLGPILSVPLVMLGRVWRRHRVLFAGLGGGALAILMEGAASPHYLAPATAALVMLIVECTRHLHAARIGIVRLLPAAMVMVLILRIWTQQAGLPYTQKLNYQSWCCVVEGNRNKARVSSLLDGIPGEHLVLVKAKTSEYNLLQWIYNSADIDTQKVVWARDLGAVKNAALISYFKGRMVWIVDPNVETAELEQYIEAGTVSPKSGDPRIP